MSKVVDRIHEEMKLAKEYARRRALMNEAAPDMLGALELVREMVWPKEHKDGVPDRLLDLVDAAISKAKGISPKVEDKPDIG